MLGNARQRKGMVWNARECQGMSCFQSPALLSVLFCSRTFSNVPLHSFTFPHVPLRPLFPFPYTPLHSLTFPHVPFQPLNSINNNNKRTNARLITPCLLLANRCYGHAVCLFRGLAANASLPPWLAPRPC